MFERIGKGGRLIGTIKKGRGSFRFTPGDGRGGRRGLTVQAEQYGLPVAQRIATRYRAPGPAKPARVRGLRVRRSGRTVTIRWRRARGATAYVVRARVKGGRQLVRLVSRRVLRIRRVDKKASVRVSVAGRNDKGRIGKAAKGKTKSKKSKSRKRKK